MQFVDLQRQYINLRKEIDTAIHAVLNNSNYIMGQEVSLLEQMLAEYVGMKYCISCANGTDALSLAMMSYDIKKGDAVFVPTFTFYASAETVSLIGATPYFVDIDKATFNISPTDLEKAIIEVMQRGNLNPRAIVAVDIFGLPFDYDAIKAIAMKYNLLLIEDGAQGFGGSIKGKKACSFGDIATTSFFPAKPLGCYGDGGAVFTADEKIAKYLKSIRIHGKGQDKYDNVRIGMNSRLDTIQAAILIEKLKAFNAKELDLRNGVANQYNILLDGLVETPYVPNKYISSYAQYSILLKNEKERDLIQTYLKEKEIPTMIYYPKCMHEQTVYRNNISIYRNFECAESVTKRILNLPMHPYMTIEEQEIIAETIKEKV